MPVERSMSVRLSLLVGDFVTNARKAGQSVNGIADAAAKPTTALQGLKTVGADLGRTMVASAGIGAAALATWATSAFATGVAYNSLQQTAGSALETLLGSAEAATVQMAELSEFARTSPFPRQMWIQAQQTLIGFGIEAERVVPILSALQDGVVAVGGSAQSIQEVVLILSKISSVGKVTAEDLNELGVRGIDAASLVGEAWGMTAADVRESMSAGAVDATEFLDTLVGQLQTKYAGAAEGLRETWVGALDRIAGATRDVGSVLAEPFVDPQGGGAAVQWANDAADALRAFQGALEPAVEVLSSRADPAFQAASGAMQNFSETLEDADIVGFLDQIGDGGPALAGFAAAAAAAGSASALSAVGMGQLAGVINPLTAGLLTAAAVSPDVRGALLELAQTAAPLVPVLTDLAIEVAGVGSSGIGMAGDLLSAAVPTLQLLVTTITPVIEVAGFLSEMISEIPGPVLAASVAVGGLTLALKALVLQVKTFGAISLYAQLVQIAGAASKAKFAIAGIAAGAILIGIDMLVQGLAGAADELERVRSVDTGGLAEDLKRLGDTGEVTAGLKQLFGAGSDGADQFKDSLGVATAGFWDWNDSLNRSFDEMDAADQRFQTLDSALAQMASTGEDADAAFQTLVDTYNLTEDQVEDLLTLLPQYTAEAERQAAANAESGDAAEEHADGLAGLEEQAEQTKVSLKTLADEMRAQVDPVFAAIQATRDLTDAQEAYDEALSEHGSSSDEARDAMLELLEAQAEAATAAGELAQVTDELPPEMLALAEAAGLSASDIEWLRDQMGEAQAAGEEFGDAISDVNADLTTSTGRMRVQNALELAGLEASYATAIIKAKASVDDLISKGWSYEDAIAEVSRQSNTHTGVIEGGFEDARAAGLEFSDEYPAEIRLEGYDSTLNRIQSIGRAIHNVPSYKRIQLDVQRTGDNAPSGEQQFATGGRVLGPAGIDQVPALMTAGEHVWTPQEVRAAGGHEAMESMRAAVLAGQTKFTHSGPVGSVSPAVIPSGRAGITVQNLNLESVNERFDTRQVMTELAYLGAV